MKRILLVLEIIVCTGSYSGLYFLKTGFFIPQGEYLILFGIYIFLWLFFTVYYKKHKLWFNSTFRDYFRSLLFSSAFTLFFLTLVVSFKDLRIVSRLFLIGIVVVPSLVELSGISLIRRLSNLNGTVLKDGDKSSDVTEKDTMKLKWMAGGFVLLNIAFFIMIRLKSGSFGYYPWCEYILLLLIGTWIISIGLTGKYKYSPSQNLYYQFAPFIKSGFIMLILAGTVYYFFRLEYLSRLVLFGTILVYTTLETGIFAFVFMVKQEPVSISKVDVSNNENCNIFGQEPLSISSATENNSESAINIQSLFNRIPIKESDKIVQFLFNHIKRNYEKNTVTLLSTASLENISVLQNQSLNLLINIHNLNDMRRLNEYLISCHNKIKPGGILVGHFIPIEIVWHLIRSRMPKFLFTVVYPIHFMFYRVLPKLPRIRHIYFVITKGKNRVISKAEVFGRLHFCGYKVIAEKMIGSTLYFIARQLKTVSNEENPSYGPIVNLKRVGLDGKIITIHKLRTMHPYSEFLQKDVYDRQNLNPSGKFKDDFRLTGWGKIMRKLFFDELPQIYDWFQGKVKIVGVRALSEHYFSLYPEDLQKERIKYKPGLVPPYYADVPNSFDGILESERTYLKRKSEKPFLTDFIYFWKAFKNIVFKGARSS